MKIEDFKVGDIILVHKKRPYKKAGDYAAPIIRYFTKCYYNHVAIIGIKDNQYYIFEAVEDGFKPTLTLENYLYTIGKEREIAVKRLKQPIISIKVFLERIDKWVGTKYDYRNTLFQQLIWYVFKIWVGSTKKSKQEKTVQCAEVLCRIYDEIFDQEYRKAPVHIWKETTNLVLLWESSSVDRILWEIKRSI